MESIPSFLQHDPSRVESPFELHLLSIEKLQIQCFRCPCQTHKNFRLQNQVVVGCLQVQHFVVLCPQVQHFVVLGCPEVQHFVVPSHQVQHFVVLCHQVQHFVVLGS